MKLYSKILIISSFLLVLVWYSEAEFQCPSKHYITTVCGGECLFENQVDCGSYLSCKVGDGQAYGVLKVLHCKEKALWNKKINKCEMNPDNTTCTKHAQTLRLAQHTAQELHDVEESLSSQNNGNRDPGVNPLVQLVSKLRVAKAKIIEQINQAAEKYFEGVTQRVEYLPKGQPMKKYNRKNPHMNYELKRIEKRMKRVSNKAKEMLSQVKDDPIGSKLYHNITHTLILTQETVTTSKKQTQQIEEIENSLIPSPSAIPSSECSSLGDECSQLGPHTCCPGLHCGFGFICSPIPPPYPPANVPPPPPTIPPPVPSFLALSSSSLNCSIFGDACDLDGPQTCCPGLECGFLDSVCIPLPH